MTTRTRKLAYGAWLAVCLIWGTTYLGIKICLETMPPGLMGGLRYMLAGLLLAGVLVSRGIALPSRSTWGGLALLGFLLLGLGNGGVVWGEQWVPSGLTAVIIATTPFWMVGIEALLPSGERLSLRRGAGLALGFGGILILVWPELRASGGAGFLAGVLAIQVACLGWALGSSYSRRHAREENALGAAALEMFFGGLCMLAAGTAMGEWDRLFFTTRTATAFIYLVIVGAIGGFAAYIYALKHLPVSTVSLYAYINPVIAVVLGALVLAEPFTIRMALGAVVILIGVWVVRSSPALKAAETRGADSPKAA